MSENLRLTRNQKKAVGTLGRSVSIRSGAGSGKTEILLRRICHILERGLAGLDEILVITSTERAAREARGHLVRQGYDWEAVELAWIGTIQRFCSRVLRENPFAAGVDPWFSVLGIAGGRDTADRVLDELIEERQGDEALAALLEELGADSVKGAVFSIQRSIASVGPGPSSQLVAVANSPMPFLRMFKRCFSELVALAESDDGIPDQLLHSISSGLLGALKAGEKLACEKGSDLDWKALQRLVRYRARFALSNGSEASRHLMEAARKALQDFRAACLDRLSGRYSESLLDLAADFDSRYAAAKAHLGLMDGNDMLNRTVDLLSDADSSPTEIASRYRDRLKFILVSQSEDAGSIQERIINLVSRRDNVFLVGDPGQAIYSYIYGDRRAGRETDRKVSIHLRENFRSRQGIADFVDCFFGKVWGEDYGPRLGKLRCAGRFATKDRPDVEIMLVPQYYDKFLERESAERARLNEARAIARKILEITGNSESDPLVHTKEGRAGRLMTLSDILILLRTKADARVYEQALEEHGIDARTIGGRAFYDSIEVQDAVALLTVVDDPLNDLAMAVVLLSPFAGVSENALFLMCRDWSSEDTANAMASKASVDILPPQSDRHGRIWDTINRADVIPHFLDSDREKLTAFRQVMRYLLDTRFRLGIAGVLDHALEKTDFAARVLSMRDGRRKYANLQMLREIARESQSRAGSGIDDFIARARELGRLSEHEMDASESEEGGFVRIMTIHRAKGLQSPIVFVADMSRSVEPMTGPFVLDPDWGLAVEVRNPLTGRSETPLCFREIRERIRDRVVSEEKRLLYVAMTRAEEHLILVGSSNLEGNYKSTYRETESWMGWLEKALELGPETPLGEVTSGGCRFTLSHGLPSVKSPPSLKLPWTSDGHISLGQRFDRELREGLPIPKSDIPPCAEEIARKALERCLAAGSPETRRASRLSVSQVLDYVECPARYRLLHIIGIPEDGVEQDKEMVEPGYGTADVGHAVHEVLAGIDFSREVEPQIEVLLSSVGEALRAEVEPVVRRFISSRWCRDIRSAEQLLKETPFETTVGGTVLVGRIDALYREAGRWTVLDYKTGRAEDRERYELQVGIYSHVVFRLLGETPARVALLYLSIGDEWVQDASDGAVAAQAAGIVREVAASISAGEFPPRPGKPCEWCSFAERCGKDMLLGR